MTETDPIKLMCIECKKDKPLSDFYFRKDTGKYFGRCKQCHLAKSKEWAGENNDKCRANAKKNYYLNIQAKRDYANKWHTKDIEKSRAIKRKATKKYRSTVTGHINANMCTAICVNLKGKKGYRKWESLVGYTSEQLRCHLESLFTKGMSWDNYGKWHIDHVIPRSFFEFDTTDDVEFKYCWSLRNLQPLWAMDNIRKNSKIIEVA